ncbi:TerB N-terminal domain-containing protein [Bradyrhizobium sp. Arg314]
MAITTGLAAADELTPARIAQKVLLERGYPIGAVDGIWGRRSAAAMSDLQKRLGLPQTGQPDALTLKALVTISKPTAPDLVDRGVNTEKKTDAVPAPPKAEPIVPTLPKGVTTPNHDVPEQETLDASGGAGHANAVRPDVPPARRPIERSANNNAAPLPPNDNKDTKPASLLFVLGLSALGIYLFSRSRARRRAQPVRVEPSFEHASVPSRKQVTGTSSPVANRPLTQRKERPSQVSSHTGTSASLQRHNAAVDEYVSGHRKRGRFNRIENELVQAIVAEFGADASGASQTAAALPGLERHDAAVNELVVSRAVGSQPLPTTAGFPQARVNTKVGNDGGSEPPSLQRHNDAVSEFVASQLAGGQFHALGPGIAPAKGSDGDPGGRPAAGNGHSSAQSLQQHSAAVTALVEAQAAKAGVIDAASKPDTGGRQDLGGLIAPSLHQHSAAVSAFVRSRTLEHEPIDAKAARPGWTSLLPGAKPRRSSAWVAADQEVTVGGRRLTKGLVYVGEQLKPQNGWLQRDNCLIVPSLQVGARADVSGQYLDYWPSYERLSPSSRAAYLDWLASDRANPATPVGYVFLYFYGLERRLMLDRAIDDRAAVLVEVARLISVYGENRSFRRYSAELIGAARAFEVMPDHEGEPAIGLGDLPIADRVELGRRASLRQPIPPALLLSLAANHPETRLKAPVRRLPQLVAECFCARVVQDHPNGLLVTLPRNVRALEVNYRAASSTFEVPVVGSAQAIPDVAQLAQPLGYARGLLASISDELDEYSREIGKANGVPTTLLGLSKLPPGLRHRQAAAVAPDSLAKLNTIADSRQIHGLKDLLALVGLKTDVSTKIGLRDLSRCLNGWGFGLVPDPHFVPKILADRSGVLVFRADPASSAAADSSEEYRLTYVTLALGVVIAQSDGRLSEAEGRFLSRLVLETPGLGDQERRRLVADLVWLEANPLAVADLKEHLRKMTAAFRTTLMARLVSVAAADGVIDSSEVAVLEHLAKTLGLDPSGIYHQLHSTRSAADDVPLVVAPELATEHAIPSEPRKQGETVNADRLAAIRAETAMASTLLGEIFDDEEEGLAAEIAPAPSVNGELDQRHRALLDELVTQGQWPRGDFDRLVRQAGLMPGSVISKLNDWSIDRCDELVLEGDDPIVVNSAAILESA